jgi:hypothetical protein
MQGYNKPHTHTHTQTHTHDSLSHTHTLTHSHTHHPRIRPRPPMRASAHTLPCAPFRAQTTCNLHAQLASAQRPTYAWRG